MSPIVLPLDLSTVVNNDVYKLSMINTSGGVYFSVSLCCALAEQILVPDSSLALLLLFYLGNLSLSVGLGVRSRKKYNLEPLTILF